MMMSDPSNQAPFPQGVPADPYAHQASGAYPPAPPAQNVTGQYPSAEQNWNDPAFAGQPTEQYPNDYAQTGPAAAPASPYPFRFAAGEELVGTYPIAQKKRLMGSVVSYLFITTQRVVYAAEAKTVFGSSTELKQHRLDAVSGVETSRRKGLGALGGALAVAMFFNLIFFIIVTSIGISAASSISSSLNSNPFASAAAPGLSNAFAGSIPMMILGVLILIALYVMVIWSLLRPGSSINIATVSLNNRVASRIDWLLAVIVIAVSLLLGPLVPVAVLIWFGLRSLGLFRAADAPLYAAPANLDVIAFEANTVITELQNQQ